MLDLGGKVCMCVVGGRGERERKFLRKMHDGVVDVMDEMAVLNVKSVSDGCDVTDVMDVTDILDAT